MKTLKEFTEEQTATVLEFSKMVANQIQPKKAPVEFSLTMSDSDSEEQVREQARRLVEHRKTTSGRQYRDDSEEGLQIREQVRKHLRSRKLLQRD